jgi:enoyl-[acyl-carrier-protein] reductase (NADH)
MNPAYSVAMGGVLSLTASVVACYGKYGIRCNAICAGFVVNEATEGKFTDEFRDMVLTHIPYTRLGTPDDLGRLASFLLSGDSDYISGQVISVDGGFDTPGPLYLPVAGGQGLSIASRTAGTISCAHRFSVVSLMVSPSGGTR